MYSEKDWSRAITKLVRLTVEGKVKWKIPEDYDPDVDIKIRRIFSSVLHDRTYVVFLYDRKNWIDEDEFILDSGLEFEIWKSSLINDFEYKIAKSPYLPTIKNLFDTIERQFASDQNALGFLLSDEE